MTVKVKLLVAGAMVIALAVTAVLALVFVGQRGSASMPGAQSTDPGVQPTTGGPRTPTQQGEQFLADWVDGGRVVRRDQGGDTVSEGQAYGLLIAVAVSDEASFDRIWSWTTKNLVRDDGLLAWQWDDGKVVDDEPASDADVDAARALVLAGEAFGRDDYAQAGETLGNAVLDKLTVSIDAGRILLPGLWAATPHAPYAYNPSYAAPASFEQLAKATHDERWTELAEGSRVVSESIAATTDLPSNWAQVTAEGSVNPMPGPTGTEDDVSYSYDAARLIVRFAESCDPDDVALAASMLAPLARHDPLPMNLDLGGGTLGDDQHPLGYVARAAANASANNDADAAADLARADELSQSTPTYYGAAWSALGALQLDDGALGVCSPLSDASDAEEG